MDKLRQFKLLLGESPEHDAERDDYLSLFLEQAAEIVLNRRYPFGFPEGTTVPERYGAIQVRIAVELFNRIGAEGETKHNENGVDRTYSSAFVSPDLLRQIVPCATVIGGESE